MTAHSRIGSDDSRSHAARWERAHPTPALVRCGEKEPVSRQTVGSPVSSAHRESAAAVSESWPAATSSSHPSARPSTACSRVGRRPHGSDRTRCSRSARRSKLITSTSGPSGTGPGSADVKAREAAAAGRAAGAAEDEPISSCKREGRFAWRSTSCCFSCCIFSSISPSSACAAEIIPRSADTSSDRFRCRCSSLRSSRCTASAAPCSFASAASYLS
mmetsp:Transcript_10914/g.36172  ORF Transcript_10914/g.36172 Transcript_10914/m.36172 type:complete len:217 (+) Transcript_10914:843-1493(+)|eukprot:scaffold22668_cov216-Isochrysis_galbana.AAC.4